MLRAYRFFRGFHGWRCACLAFGRLVRNTCYTWLEKNRPVELMTEFDEELHPQPSVSPETLDIAGSNRERLARALGDTAFLASAKSSFFANSKAVLIRKFASITAVPIEQ